MPRPSACHSALVLPILGLMAVAVGSGTPPRPTGGQATPEATPPVTPAPLVFGRDVRPLLSDRCFACHGPDPAKRSANLRLDLQEAAWGPLPQHPDQHAIVPGDPTRSAIIQRITSSDPLRQMPPPSSHLSLSPAERELLTRWVHEGARYEPHFAYTAPVQPPLPTVRDASWVRNDVDRFILARLEERGLGHAAEADRATLLRRVSLDLTGLPPTPAETADFLADTREDAYERQVDRLLASPRYGEHLAAWWLDLARYADSHGFQSDPERFMSAWRDWVIDAFNRNLPFDQFTIDQLAGDLLPEAREDQVIATGFNRNHRINSEGGAIDEEWRIEQVLDRAETTSAVWLGLTMNCARCHDHKYDPLTQKDYYRFASFFNNVDEKGLDTSINQGGNTAPLLRLGSPTQRAQLRQVEEAATTAESAYDAVHKADRSAAITAWIAGGATLAPLPEARLALPLSGDLAGAPAITSAGKPVWISHGTRKGLDLRDRNPGVAVPAPALLTAGTPVTIAWWQHETESKATRDGAGVVLTLDGGPRAGVLAVRLNDKGKLVLHYANEGIAARESILQAGLGERPWRQVLISWDGTASVPEVRVDGELQILDPGAQGEAAKDIAAMARSPRLTVGGPGASAKGANEGAAAAISGVVVYDRILDDRQAATLAVEPRVREVMAKTGTRSKADHDALGEAYDLVFTTEDRLRLQRDLAVRERNRLLRELPNVMVMREMAAPRAMHILERGQYDHPTTAVTAGTPAFLPAMPADAPNNRLGLARWLVQGNPLTARVLVNRMWDRLFGTGIVKTVENIGVQCSWPSHPALLDHLALRLEQDHWDLKRLLRLLVTSATYRQDTRITPAAQEADPENLLLWHGPRFRLPAEVLRDQALAASGLLVERIGGPSVRPYLPADIWAGNRFGNLAKYEPSQGPDLWRRSLYTFHKRTAPPTNATIFDMPSREYCTISRSRTNTPLQALTMLNDPTYLEAARVLGQRLLREGGSRVEQRIDLLMRLVLGRAARSGEVPPLRAAWERYQARYAADPAVATALIGQGRSPVPADLPPADLAAAMLVASTVLNLDETVNKP